MDTKLAFYLIYMEDFMEGMYDDINIPNILDNHKIISSKIIPSYYDPGLNTGDLVTIKDEKFFIKKYVKHINMGLSRLEHHYFIIDAQ